MKAEHWKKHIIDIVNFDDMESLELLTKLLEEADEAKQELRNKGYGWTGLSLLKTVIEEVPNSI